MSSGFDAVWQELERYYRLVQRLQRDARSWDNPENSGPPLGTPVRRNVLELRDDLLHGELAAHQEHIGRLLGRW